MDYVLKPYKKGQEKQISEFVMQVYDEFVSKDYSEEGNRLFYQWIDPDLILKRQRHQVNILQAYDDQELIGVIEIRDQGHIALLFVDKRYQGQGIARTLLDEMIRISLSRTPDLNKMTVNASPVSIPVYEKLGFLATENLQEKNGIIYLPMEKGL